VGSVFPVRLIELGRKIHPVKCSVAPVPSVNPIGAAGGGVR
jgi:hypothetical protein